MLSRSRIVIVLFSIFTFSGSIAMSSTPEKSSSWGEWQQAKANFDTRQYEAAFQEVKNHPRNESNYFYNLGTLQYHLGNKGLAVAYLEKANRLESYEPSTQFNLAIARSALKDMIGVDQLDPASTWIEQVADRISLDEVRATLGLLALIIVLFWMKAYLRSRKLRKVLLRPAGLVGLIGFIITLGIYGIQRWVSLYPPAISLTQQKIHSGPGSDFAVLGQLESGTKIRLMGASATGNPDGLGIVSGEAKQDSFSPDLWLQVRYSEDGVGWVKSSNLLTL
jgi:tetratricopeptide (TPR) repeat protein